jgi:hypothetical protein
MSDETTSNMVLPAGLWNWAGHKAGGVRRLFYEASGRPSGQVIRTPLLARLERWAGEIARGEYEAPRGVALVGGPGNGKTEAVEFAIEALDTALGLERTLRDAVAAQFNGQGEQPPPRMARVDLREVSRGRLDWTLSIVQDASAPDAAQPRISPAALLLEELKDVLASGERQVYLACVNRGVLDDALILATDAGHAQVAQLLQEMVNSVGQSLDATPCWPLPGFPAFATWPMDVESLVVSSAGGEPSAAFQLLQTATDEGRWPPYGTCAAGELCPYCTSRRSLSNEPHRGALLQVLRWYELAAGKRWSFRDLFSLVSFLLAGAPGETKGKAKISPCEHAAQLLRLGSVRAETSAAQRRAAPFVLAAAQYHHALFGIWAPRGLRVYWENLGKLGLQKDEVLAGLYHFLARPSAHSIPHTLTSQLADLVEALDPALAEPGSTVRLSKATTIAFRDLDVRFSQSTREGLAFIRQYHCLTNLDTNLLASLAAADDALLTIEAARKHPQAAAHVQAWVRDFACRYTRRAVGVRGAATREATTLAAFERVAGGDVRLLHEAVKQVDALLNNGDRFAVSLNTTFGEPLLPVQRRAVLVTTKQKVRSRDWPDGERPRPPTRFLEVGAKGASHSIALTYELYRSVLELRRGMQPASLPRPVVALLDAIRARLAGAIVRSEESLEDGQIRIGTRNEFIVRELGHFLVQKDDE